jgi:hypothetical protein
VFQLQPHGNQAKVGRARLKIRKRSLQPRQFLNIYNIKFHRNTQMRPVYLQPLALTAQLRWTGMAFDTTALSTDFRIRQKSSGTDKRP